MNITFKQLCVACLHWLHCGDLPSRTSCCGSPAPAEGEAQKGGLAGDALGGTGVWCQCGVDDDGDG